MKKWWIFGIIGIVVVLVIIGIFVSMYVRRECETATDCLTKTCFIAECSNNKCVYSPIADCCGNDRCEVGETYKDCVIDCPNCDDKNNCTIDEYDYHEQKCVNKPILDVICCGNGICEIGEDYENCTRDCPNCDNNNNCTSDSYDYHEQKCINELIIPCCGSGICDEGAETYLNCSIDCPNCDDDNKLTTDSFNYATQECENPVTHYFIDDFESGTENWVFYDAEGKPTTAWHTIMDSSNTILRGTGHNWAKLENKRWTDYILKVRFKMIKGSMQFNYRLNTGDIFTRYTVQIREYPTRISLVKSTDSNTHFDVGGGEKRIQLDKNRWHTLEIRGYDNILNVYIDDKLLIKHRDTEYPILSGGVAFECMGESEFLVGWGEAEFLIDDVEVRLIGEGDVVYP
ncbi:MAG: DUF1080 domain-containing protein [Nanoarchaeota archaeon]|nr:DUF1080 domain-containing protein [Nanoarchaeota archaeon]